MFFNPPEITWLDYLAPYTAAYRTLESVLVPPPAPLTGLSSIIPPYGVHIDRNALELKHKEAITSLSIRLGTDKWFLGSAYVSCILRVMPIGLTGNAASLQCPHRPRRASVRVPKLPPSFAT